MLEQPRFIKLPGSRNYTNVCTIGYKHSEENRSIALNKIDF